MLNLEEGSEVLSKLLNDQKLIAFVGSGISVDSDLPTWDGFLLNFVDFCKNIRKEYRHQDKESIDKLLSDSVLSNAYEEINVRPAHVAMVLKEALLKMPDDIKTNIERDFRRWFYREFATAEPNKKHYQIIETNYPFILTSNYDLLLEDAQKSSTTPRATYSLFDKEDVAEAIYLKRKSIIHVHGTYEDALFDKIIFTAKDYIEIVKKKHPGSSFILQTMFLQYSTVFFGYGASDPHLEDLMEELSYFLDFSQRKTLPKCYLVVLKDKIKSDGIFERYKNHLRTELIAIDSLQDYDELLNKLYAASPIQSNKKEAR